VITIEIDLHKSSLTAVALDPTGRQLGARRFPVNAGTLRAVLAWTVGRTTAPDQRRSAARAQAHDAAPECAPVAGRGPARPDGDPG
jgi:hypothetical protein